MFTKNITKREKLIFLFTVVVILAVLCYNFLIAPVFKKTAFVEKEIVSKQIELKKITKLLSAKEQILQAYEKYTKDISLKGVSNEEAVAHFLAKVESLARASSVLINDVKPKPVKDLAIYKRFNFDLELEGSIESITKFIYELESSPEAIRIERLQISVKTGKENILKADLSIAKLAFP